MTSATNLPPDSGAAVPEPSRRRRWQIGAIVFVAALASSSWTFPLGSDGAAMMATAQSLLDRGTLAIDSRFATDDANFPSGRVGADGRTYASHGLGLPIAELPFLAVARGASAILGIEPAPMDRALLSLLNPLLTSGTAMLIFAIGMRLGASEMSAGIVSLAYVFTTYAWAFAVADTTEALQTCVVAAAAWALIVFAQTRRRRALWICGAALGFGVVTNPTLALLIPAFVAGIGSACWSHGWRGSRLVSALTAWCLPLLGALVAVASLNMARFGSFLETGYNPPLFTTPLLAGLYGLMVGPNKGLIFYAPAVLLLPFAAAGLRRASPPLSIAAAIGGAIWIGIHASFFDWPGGWGWGPRYLLPILPFAFVALATVADQSRLQWPVRILLIAGFAVNLLGVVVSETAYRHATSNMWVAQTTGTMTTGSVIHPGTTLEVPRAPEDVIPSFSSIAGHWWLARVRLSGCDCTPGTPYCACVDGPFETNFAFLSPPWRDDFRETSPSPPYTVSIVQPLVLRRVLDAIDSRIVTLRRRAHGADPPGGTAPVE